MKLCKHIFALLLCVNCAFSQLLYADSYIFNFNLSDFYVENTTEGAMIFPLKDNYVLLEDITLPALPVCFANVLLPQNTRVLSVSYQLSDQHVVPNVRHVLNNIPACPTDKAISQWQILHNQVQQDHASYPTQNVSLVSEESYGMYRYATIQICPFTYYVDSCLLLQSQIHISIETEPVGATTITDGRCNKDLLRQLIINPDALPDEEDVIRDGLPNQTVDYLIITRDSLKQAFLPLAYWKTIKGVKTQVITLEEIYSNYSEPTHQLQIKRCLQYFYNYHNLKWALLGGDDTIVPTINCFKQINDTTPVNAPCDLFYCCFNGRFDWNANGNDTIGELADSVSFIPSVYLSRLPIRTKKHVSTYVQKLLRYEQQPPLQNYVKRMLLSGRHIWKTYPNGLSDAQLKSELFYSTYIQQYWNGTKYRFYDSDTDFGGSTYDLTPENINEQLNTGYHFVHYASHGEIDSLPTEANKYSPYYVRQLENNKFPSVFVTMACHTNYFDSPSRDPCLSEAFIRHPSGAICYFGCSRYGFGDINNSPTHISLGLSFRINGVFFQSLFKDKITHFAETAAYAKLSVLSSSYSEGAYRWLQFALNPVGDPELPIYTDNPIKFSNITIARTGNEISVNTNNIDSCTITVTSADDYGDTYFSVLRNASTGLFTNVPASYFVVITKHNYVPYIYSSPMYIQNEVILNERIINNVASVVAGESVTPLKPQGNVIIQSGGKLEIYNADSVILDKGFEVKLGGELNIY